MQTDQGGKERQDNSFKRGAITAGTSSQSLNNMLLLDFNSVNS